MSSEVTVEDRVLIRDLYDRFYMAMNEGDEEGIKASFAPDGRIGGPEGRGTREQTAATGVLWRADPIGRTYHHHVTNLVIDVDPEGREDFRFVRGYELITGVWDPPYVIVRWSCKSEDLVRRIDGRWVFAIRKIEVNHEATADHWENEPRHPAWDFEKNQPA